MLATTITCSEDREPVFSVPTLATTLTTNGISATVLTAGNNAANQKIYTTTAVAPAANALITVAVLGHNSTSAPAPPAVTGGGMTTWDQVATITFDAGTTPHKRLTIYRAMNSAPGSGPLTITFGATESNCQWIVTQWSGVETSGSNGAAAIVQTTSTSGSAVSGLTATLAPLGNASNVALGVFGVNASTAVVTSGAGFTELADQGSGESPAADLEAEWGINDNSVDATWGSLNGAALAVEIKASAAVLPPPPVATVTVSPATTALTVGATLQLTATLRDANGNILSGRTVAWASSDATVATVSPSGLVTGAGAGSTTITATSEGQSGSATVTVTVAPVATVTVSPPTAQVTIGTKVQLTATPKDSAGNPLPGRVISWASSDSSVAVPAADGSTSGIAVGTATITATSEGKSGSSAVTVTVVPVASVSVTPASLALQVGGTAQLTATPKDASGTVLVSRVVSWATTAAPVATVDGNGLVTGVSSGSATISATSEGKSGSTTVTVGAVVAVVEVTPPAPSIPTGSTVQLTATPRDAGGNPVSGRTSTWTSSSSTIAKVSSAGLVTGKAVGTATITATCDGKSGSTTVTVFKVPVASVVVAPPSAVVQIGGKQQLVATPLDSTGAPLSGRAISWSSGDQTIATVSTAGLVTTIALGTVTIAATSEGKTGTAQITVSPPFIATVDVVSPAPTLDVGSSAQLTASPKDGTGAPVQGHAIVWIVSDPSVASIDQDGLVTAIGAGSVAVIATTDGASGAAVITVTCPGTWPVQVYPRMPFSSGQAFFVSPSGSDANPGTFGAPWQTLQKAFSALQPGQVAYLRGGTYGALCATTTFSGAGSAAAPITVQGFPGERAVLHGIIQLKGSYFRLAYIVAEGPTCGTWGAPSQQGDNLIKLVLGSSHHIEISSSEIYHDGYHAGLSIYGDDIYILNNYIHDNGAFNDPTQSNVDHGIYYHEGNRGIIANNLLEHNYAKGLSARATGNGVFVINNTVVGNGRSGIDITENTYNWLVANNVIMNNGNVNDGWGINTNGSAGGATNLEVNNVVWHNGTIGTDNWTTNGTIQNNLAADPLLVNPATSVLSTDHVGYSNDYHLGSGSPAFDFGSTTYALPLAYGPACRPQSVGPDAGAYER